MLMVVNVGAAGTISTIHAKSALDALERLTVLCQMAPDCWPWEPLRRVIGWAVNIVVHLDQRSDGMRFVAEAVRLMAYDAESDCFKISRAYRNGGYR
jgi:pilus assembly protein CpaF